jgi:hypothetical protein
VTKNHRFVMLKRLVLAVSCLFLFVAPGLADQAQRYLLIPLSETTSQCNVNPSINACVMAEALVLKPNNEFVVCTATFDTAGRVFRFSATSAPSCWPIQCSTCDLIPPIPPTENGQQFSRSFSHTFPEKLQAAMYWGINEQTGILTVCAIDPPTAECKTVRP